MFETLKEPLDDPRTVSGNTRSRRVRRRGGSFETDCGGTTKSARIKRGAIKAESNSGRKKSLRWLDFRGALQNPFTDYDLVTSIVR